MKRHHKYFRKERYKQKLERDVDKHKTYYSNVFFITQEPDPKYIPDRGKDYFTYYDKPEVPYSIQYYHKSPRRSARCVDLKKRTNKRLRQRWRQYGEVYQNNEYRRVHEYWWELD